MYRFAWVVLILGLSTSILDSQTQSALSFEAATIKQEDSHDPQGIRGWNCRGFDMPNATGGPQALLVGMGRCRVLGWPLRQIIASAYSIGGKDRVLGGEGWVDSLPYVIEAKADDSIFANRVQLVQMLQNLLADRFKLRIHRETRQLDGFALVLKPGAKLTEVQADTPPGMSTSPGSIEGVTTAAILAGILSGPIGRPVIDKTGLTGRYRVSLKWTPGPGESGFKPNADPGPSIIGVLQDLGFRLEPAKVPMEYILIDSAEKPAG